MTRSDFALAKSRRDEAAEFRLLFVASFPFFLAAAAIGRLLPRRWRGDRRGLSGYRSIFGEARASANACVPFAFMG